MWIDSHPADIPDFTALVGKHVLYCTSAEIEEMGGKSHYFPKSASVKMATRDIIVTDGVTIHRHDLVHLLKIAEAE